MSDPSATLFVLSTIKVRPGKMPDFCALMPRLVPIMEAHGWRLLGALTNLGGRINVVVDIWQIPDANALPGGLGALMSAFEWPDIARALGEYVEDEVIQLMSRLPFDPGRIADHCA
jgi:hypothetical protein